MKKTKYQEAIEWLAFHDNPSEMDFENVKNSMLVALTCSIFKKEAEQVASKILNIRLVFNNRDL